MAKMRKNLKEIVHNIEGHVREKGADTLGSVTYCITTGAALDAAAGLNLKGIIASRTSALLANALTGAPYGMWRNLMYKLTRTNDKSSHARKYLTDLLAFNTFQVPFYAGIIGLASLVSEGKVDLNKAEHGALYLAAISPFIGPTMGWYMDKVRKLFGAKSAAEKAYKKTEEQEK